MSHRFLASYGLLAALLAVVLLAVAPLAGQAPPAGARNTSGSAKNWTPPRTVDGQPDIQGVWANNVATPLERPQALAGKQVLSDAEVAALQETARQLFDGETDAAFGDSVFETVLQKAKGFTSRDAGTGNYNHFWLVERNFDNRTSLVTDPPDGRLPQLTPEGQKKREAARIRRGRPAIGPEDRGLGERCISFGSPRLGAGYNSYYHILQSAGYVAIVMETIHDARIIPLDGRPHVGKNIRQWLGDSRGHWEGNTLIVDTINYSSKSDVAGGGENAHVTERFTRISADTLQYEVTVNDPATWTKPWTAMVPMRRSQDKVFEFACHEGNAGLHGILAGARAQEKAAEEAAKKSSR
jgi:hypothetical protein